MVAQSTTLTDDGTSNYMLEVLSDEYMVAVLNGSRRSHERVEIVKEVGRGSRRSGEGSEGNL